MQKIISFFFLLFLVGTSIGQKNTQLEFDKCGHDPVKDALLHKFYGPHWGYSYDSLLNDMAIWENSDYVQAQSIGQSTQGREQYELTITNFEVAKNVKRRIFIHARTHPGEIQAFRVTDEMINYLIADTEIGNFLRERCIFHITPMYNPDGVELDYPRENANGIDIESNWSAEVPEVEVLNLRSRMQELMLEENPIEIALNMHSSVDCERYFWVHHANGTSSLYFDLEEEFVEGIRSHFLEGMEPYNSHVSWSGGNPGVYPESWWWSNYAEQVMALTYEDMNCTLAGEYDRTAYAMLYGISDYLGLGFIASQSDEVNYLSSLKAYPNPFREEIKIEFANIDQIEAISITDLFGKQIMSFSNHEIQNNQLYWNGKDFGGNEVPDGIYILNFISDRHLESIKLIKQ